jgi:hypothetical protein
MTTRTTIEAPLRRPDDWPSHEIPNDPDATPTYWLSGRVPFRQFDLVIASRNLTVRAEAPNDDTWTPDHCPLSVEIELDPAPFEEDQ